MVVLLLENNKNKTKDNLIELEVSLAPAEAEIWAVAKADQLYSGESGRNTILIWV